MEILTNLTLLLTFLGINDTHLIKQGKCEKAAYQTGMKRCRLPSSYIIRLAF